MDSLIQGCFVTIFQKANIQVIRQINIDVYNMFHQINLIDRQINYVIIKSYHSSQVHMPSLMMTSEGRENFADI